MLRISYIGISGLITVLFCSSPTFSQSSDSVRTMRSRTAVIEYAGTIHPAANDFLSKSVERANEDDFHCAIIVLDTPGGLMESMRGIIKSILQSDIPIIVYISPAGSRAASAGVFITYAAHVAAMAPGTNIGAAHPVVVGSGGMGGVDSAGTMMEKIENDAVAYIQSIADKWGRNANWAEDAVRKSVSITAREALEKNVVNFVVPSIDSLLIALDGRRVTTEAGEVVLRTRDTKLTWIQMGWRHRLLSVIGDPNIAYILMMVGVYGLILELYNPGSILPGVAGGICLILAFFAFQTLPINAAGLLLIGFSIILFIAEIKVPSFGLLTVGGVISLFLGSLMLIESPIPALQLSLSVVIPSVIFTALFFIVIVGFGLKAQRRKSVSGREGLIGERGRVTADLAPVGQIAIHGEIWSAQGKMTINTGEEVEVVGVQNMRLKVKRTTPET